MQAAEVQRVQGQVMKQDHAMLVVAVAVVDGQVGVSLVPAQRVAAVDFKQKQEVLRDLHIAADHAVPGPQLSRKRAILNVVQGTVNGGVGLDLILVLFHVGVGPNPDLVVLPFLLYVAGTPVRGTQQILEYATLNAALSRSVAIQSSCGGTGCSGSTIQSQTCNTQCCPVNCQWYSWTDFNSCSVSCGGGTQSRSRSVAVFAFCGGNSCPGEPTDTRVCNTHCCPVNCQWSSWNSFNSCSVSCGGGNQTRSRSVAITAFCGGNSCLGNNTDGRECNTQCCPVNCQWSSWTGFDSCSVSCGVGNQSRSRSVAISAFCGGSSCTGNPTDTRVCNTECCPVTCQWSSWNPFNSCSVSCGGGNQSRSRSVAISALCGGSSCAGEPTDTRLCNTLYCPIHCAWENWAQWDECNVTCGGGIQERKRQVAIEAMHGGIGCSGFTSESRSCNEICCPVACQWDVWASWGECSKSCGAGSQERRRNVLVEESCGGETCAGNATQVQLCNDVCCSLDCKWTEWTGWNRCSTTCDGGIQSRKREVATQAFCQGLPCTGATNETRECSLNCCPVDCIMSEWSEWGSCSATCGTHGYKTRTRNITRESQCGGQTCSNDLVQTSTCNRECLNGGNVTTTECICKAGWAGACCETDVKECQVNLHNCNVHADCINTFGGFHCICKEGYTGDGITCLNINECNASTTCHTKATCTDNQGSYTCTCNDGYTGDGQSCNDTDECSEAQNDCDISATCQNTEGSYTCTCNAGYTGNGTSCQNLNECDFDMNGCDQNADCVDRPGSFTCICIDGYSGNGTVCTDINECKASPSPCHSKATCTNTDGRYQCDCNDGFMGDGTNCTDKNECIETEGSVPLCPNHSSCINTHGSYHCDCDSGFKADMLGKCNDIDECASATNNSSVCNTNEMCVNGMGSYTCMCNTGYQRRTGSQCLDIDECALGSQCWNNSYCKNTIGSYACLCDSGYTKATNGTCQDINECLLPNHGCHSKATCYNLDGDYVCECNGGYMGNGTYCQNIDECLENTTDCHTDATCSDTEGFYNCICKKGYTGDGLYCTDLNECEDPNSCPAIGSECTNLPGSYSCACKQGYSGDGSQCSDINECELGIDNCQGKYVTGCKNLMGSFTCTCAASLEFNGNICAEKTPPAPTGQFNEQVIGAESQPKAPSTSTMLALFATVGAVVFFMVIFIAIRIYKIRKKKQYTLQTEGALNPMAINGEINDGNL
ncbi:uncharacterized protein LOC100177897 [Ciona intestinalis]